MNESQIKERQEREIFLTECKLMIANDLRKADFHVKFNVYDTIMVGLLNRKVSVSEIDEALQNAGYDPCQYQIDYSIDPFYLFVKPIA